MTGYEISRSWFNFCFENPEKITPNHCALLWFAVEHCNRLGWKNKFGLPTTMAKEAIGIRSYNTYINTLNDLVDWGFINLIERSKNQYSSNIVALSKNDKAHNKALDKALIKHTTKQSESTRQSIYSIDKQYNNITNNNEQDNSDTFIDKIKSDDLIYEYCYRVHKSTKENFAEIVDSFFIRQKADGKKWKDFKDCKKHFNNWIKFYKKENGNTNDKIGRMDRQKLTDFINGK